MTRTQNSFLNFITGTFASLLSVVLSFITRAVFLRTLGESYLGLEGLFADVLTMLSLSELGFGVAISFKLYKPIEEGDRPRMQVLMKFYRQVYTIIGWVIAGTGICLIPFLPHVIRDYDSLTALHLNATVIFLLYLFNSASSYWFFAYKSSFVNATQKGYLLTILGYAVSIGASVAKILVLALTRDFILYIFAGIAFTLIRNLLYARACDKRYPFLREKISDSISKEERHEFFKDCSALLLYRINGTVLYGSDNLVLSAFLGLRHVALYASYVSLRGNLASIINSVLGAIQASLGSLYATGNLEWSRLVYRTVHLAACWMYGVGCVGLAVLADDFILMWLGPRFVVNSWTVGGTVIHTPMSLFIGIQLFVTGLGRCSESFRNAMGLFQEMKYRPVIGMIVNLGLNLLFVRQLGIAACSLSTIIATACVNLTMDPVIIHRYALKQSPKGHFLRMGAYSAAVAAGGLISWWLCALIPLEGVFGFILHGCVCVTVTSAVFVLCFRRTREFRFLVRSARDLIVTRADLRIRFREEDEPHGD